MTCWPRSRSRRISSARHSSRGRFRPPLSESTSRDEPIFTTTRVASAKMGRDLSFRYRCRFSQCHIDGHIYFADGFHFGWLLGFMLGILLILIIY